MMQTVYNTVPLAELLGGRYNPRGFLPPTILFPLVHCACEADFYGCSDTNKCSTCMIYEMDTMIRTTNQRSFITDGHLRDTLSSLSALDTRSTRFPSDKYSISWIVNDGDFIPYTENAVVAGCSSWRNRGLCCIRIALRSSYRRHPFPRMSLFAYFGWCLWFI